MIKRLVIYRFRGIREGVLDGLGKINLLIGLNNSGKTAILEMLYLGGTSGRSAQLVLDDVPVGEGENIAFQSTTSVSSDFLGAEPLPRLRQRHGYPPKWTDAPVTLTDEGGLEVNLAASVPQTPWRSFRLGAPLPEWGLKDKKKFYKKDAGVVALFSLDKQEGIPTSLIPELFQERKVTSGSSRWHYLWDPAWVYRWEQQASTDHLAVWAEEGTPPAPNRVLFFDFHTAGAHFTQRFAQWAKNHPWDWAEKIGKHLGRVFPELRDVKIEIDDAPEGQKGEAGYVRGAGGRIVIDQFGDGARHTFKLMASLLALTEVVDKEHPGLFLWEDPELFMHPATLGRLLDEVATLVQEKPIQVFISTQSLEVLAWIGKMLDEESLVDKAVNAYALTLQKGGELHSRLFQGSEISEWLRSGFDLRDVETAMVDLSPLSWRLKSSQEEELLW